jgi:hypothetical protein
MSPVLYVQLFSKYISFFFSNAYAIYVFICRLTYQPSLFIAITIFSSCVMICPLSVHMCIPFHLAFIPTLVHRSLSLSLPLPEYPIQIFLPVSLFLYFSQCFSSKRFSSIHHYFSHLSFLVFLVPLSLCFSSTVSSPSAFLGSLLFFPCLLRQLSQASISIFSCISPPFFLYLSSVCQAVSHLTVLCTYLPIFPVKLLHLSMCLSSIFP